MLSCSLLGDFERGILLSSQQDRGRGGDSRCSTTVGRSEMSADRDRDFQI